MKNNKAFTLIEALIAISILMIAITAPLVIISTSIKSSYLTKEQMTAYYLAHDSIEKIRQKRDSNYLYNLKNTGSPRDWYQGVIPLTCYNQNAGSGNNWCNLDKDGNFLNSDTSIEFYDNYRRKIYFEPIASSTGIPNEVILNVEVSWTKQNNEVEVYKLRETLYDWKLQ